MVKAQAKIQQMAFMLIGVFFFFALVGVFLISFKLSSVKKDADLLDERNALLLVTKLAESPEFSCGESFGGKRINCVDFDKMFVLKGNINTYGNFWGVYNIEVMKLDSNPEIECTSNTYPNCNSLKIYERYSQGFDYSTYVSLCRKDSYNSDIYDKCELAKLIVSYEKNEI